MVLTTLPAEVAYSREERSLIVIMEVPEQPLGATGTAEDLQQPTASVKPPFRLHTISSLRYPDYRLLWFGTLFSSSGQWIQQVSIGWLTYDLTGSAFTLGLVNGLRSLPMLFLGPFGGVAADRLDRKSLMLSTQIGLAVLTAVFAVTVATGHADVRIIALFTVLTGVGWAFNMPVRQSVVCDLVPRDELANAIAVNSAGFNITRVIGTSVGGVLIAVYSLACVADGWRGRWPGTH